MITGRTLILTLTLTLTLTLVRGRVVMDTGRGMSIRVMVAATFKGNNGRIVMIRVVMIRV